MEKKKKLKESKSLLQKLMTFGARDKAKKAPKEKFLKKSLKNVKLKREKDPYKD